MSLDCELRADGKDVSVSDSLGDFYWTYDDGYLFSSENPDMVLEAFPEEDAIRSGGIRMAQKSKAICQMWRVLSEYEDEDPEFRPAFALGSHKMDSEGAWEETKRKVKPFNQKDDYDPGYNDLVLDREIKDIVWKRPEEIASFLSNKRLPPKFVKEGITRFDINQGFFGDCWVMSTIANLASTIKQHPEILEQIFDPNQSFEDGNHFFTFRFFKNGVWQNVTVDDYLPWNKSTHRLLGVSSTDPLGVLALPVRKSIC